MSGKAYPRPTYLPPLSIFNPIFFPQVFPSGSTGGGGGGGQTNDFPNGILSGNTLTMYSTTGTDRNIYGISLLEFSDSTTNDYTDITTTMELTGSTFTINNTNTSSIINFVADSVQVNGVAVGVGTGNVSNNQPNTFLTGYTQTFQGPVLIDNTELSFSNGGYIGWGNGTSLLDFPATIPNSNPNSGLGMSWNTQSGTGEVDMIAYGQGGQGGFAFYAITTTSSSPTLIANMFPNGIDFKQNIVSNNTFTGNNYFNTGFINLENITGTFPSTPLGYSQFVSYNGNPWFSPTNGGGVQITTSTSLTTALLPYALLASPTFTGNPTAPNQTYPNSSTTIANTSFVSTNFAPLASPTFTGVPISTTPVTTDNTTQIATTAYVKSNLTSYAPLASPTFTGVPISTTPVTTDNTTKIATTAYVKSNLTSYAPLASPNFTGTPTAVTATAGTNTTQLATTAFVQNAIGSFPVSTTIASSVGIINGSVASWDFTIPNTTPLYGQAFSYILYTDITQSISIIFNGDPISIINNYGIMTGNGCLQPYNVSTTTLYAYILSNINYMGRQFSISPTATNGYSTYSTITITSTNTSNYAIKLKMKITPTL